MFKRHAQEKKKKKGTEPLPYLQAMGDKAGFDVAEFKTELSSQLTKSLEDRILQDVSQGLI